MIIFEDVDDVIEWLEPMNYRQVWDAVRPYAVFSDKDRDHCDGLIAGGKVKPDSILRGLKTMARLSLTDKFDLKDRIHDPVDRQYLRCTH